MRLTPDRLLPDPEDPHRTGVLDALEMPIFGYRLAANGP
jgi:hypothetical protein